MSKTCQTICNYLTITVLFFRRVLQSDLQVISTYNLNFLYICKDYNLKFLFNIMLFPGSK